MIKITLNRLPEIDRETNEAYKQLRTNLMFCGSDIKTVMVTSTHPGEGKSEVSWFMARALAESGRRVILLDADIRKSVMAGRLQPDRRVHGLSHYLAGKEELDNVICMTNVPELYMIFAGVSVPNPSELLGGRKFAAMLEALRRVFDYIIIDSPPIGSVIDAAVIGAHVDGAVLVVGYEDVSYKSAAKSVAQLKKSGCRMLGAVLNQVDMSKGSYYGGYYGNYYGNYGDNDAGSHRFGSSDPNPHRDLKNSPVSVKEK